MQNTYLAHYGVKGMKWGIRKARDVYKADRKQIKSDYKSGKYTKIQRNQALGRAAKKRDSSIDKAYYTRGKELAKGKKSTTGTRAKMVAAIVGGVVGAKLITDRANNVAGLSAAALATVGSIALSSKLGRDAEALNQYEYGERYNSSRRN